MKVYQRLATYGPALLLAVIFLSAWQFYTSLANVPATVLPSPWRIVKTLVQQWEVIYKHSQQTLLETILGFALATVTAIFLAFLMDLWSVTRLAIYPWLVASQTLPIVALAPLMLLWFGFGLLPKVVLVALFCFFPIVVALTDGLARGDETLLKLMRSMRASYWQTLRFVRLKLALPSFFSGLKIAITYSVTAAIFAEFTGGFAGLGILMQTAANSRATPLVFAAILVTALASLALFAVVVWLERIFVNWR